MNVLDPTAKRGEIRTHSGQYVNLLNPDPETILIEDIAHSLSNICRFTGATYKHYSVAQHSVFCSVVINTEFAMEGLMHDAAEAYLNDLAKPLKLLLPEYCKIEDNFMQVIAQKFGLVYPFPECVKETDEYALRYEYNLLMLKTDLFPEIKIMTPDQAKAEFLDMYAILKDRKLNAKSA